jgi:hypothetical protein
MNFPCKLFLWSCLCCLLAMPVQAQEDGQGRAALHRHPPQNQPLHEKFYSAICPIILPLAVAIRRTATRLKSSTLTANFTRSAERTGSTFPFHLKR